MPVNHVYFFLRNLLYLIDIMMMRKVSVNSLGYATLYANWTGKSSI